VLLRHLRYFSAVAEEGSLKRAAAKLRLAQPALSRQMKSLEDEIGVPLLDRGRRGVEVTAAGRALLASVGDALARLQLALGRAQKAHAGQLGRVRVGLSRLALSSSRIGQALVSVRRQLPEVELLITEASPFANSAALRAGELDLMLGVSHDDERGLESEALFDDPIDSAILARSHPLASSKQVTVAELRPHTLFVPRESPGRYPRLYRDLEEARLGWREVDSVDTVFALVSAGLGWSIGTRGLAESPPYGTVIIPVEDFASTVPLQMRRRANESSRLIGNVATLLNAEITEREARPRRAVGRATPPRLAQQSEGLPAGLELRQLHSFVAAIEERSLSAAAERVGLTQSGLSRQVRTLERQLGCVLLQRAPHGVRGTVAGDVFHAEAHNVLRLFDAAVSSARRAARGQSESCVIGMLPPELTSGVVVHSLRHITQHHPWIELELREMGTSEQIVALLSGRIDIGIGGSLPMQLEDPSIASVLLAEDPIENVLVAETHPLASQSWVRPTDLAQYPFVFLDRALNPRLYDVVMQSFAHLGLVLNTTGGSNSLRAMWRMTADTNGWTTGARSLRAAAPARLVAVPVEGLSIPWSLRLLWRQDGIGPSATQVLEVFRRAR